MASSKFVPLSGPIVGTSMYVNNKIVARDCARTFPEVTPVVVDVPSTGTLSLPCWQLIENMETAVTKIGVDMGFRDLVTPEPMTWETRWVQTVTDANSITKNVGCKAYERVLPIVIPGISLTVGEQSENEIRGTVTRFQLFVDGVEMFLIDKIAGIVRIAGKDYAAGVSSML